LLPRTRSRRRKPVLDGNRNTPGIEKMATQVGGG
jgi:hypothetical protein